MSGLPNSLRPNAIVTPIRALLRGRRSRKPKAPADGMALQAVPICVAADLTLLTPTMRVAVVEDACWALATHAWREHKPVRWRRAARRAWAAEGRALDAKRDRIRELVTAALDELPQFD